MAKKIICMLLALSMMLTVLAACNNEPVVDETPDDGQQQEDIQGNDKVEEPFDGTLKLVVDGVSDYVIVRGENAYISEVTASTELQKYLKQISGVEIPIVTDATAPVEKEIVVGKTNRESDGEFNRDELGDDGLVIKSNGQKLFLVGGEQRGTLYAVYEFLESYLGCRFYTADFELVPETKTITLEKIEEDKQIPVFEYRYTDWAVPRNQVISVKRRINGNSLNGAPIYEEYGGSFSISPFVHTFNYLISFAEYSETHPEYFAHYDDGTIVDNNLVQLCLTNETVLQMSIETVRNWINSTPNVNVVSISQNDGGGPCMCSNCQAVYAEENGAYSGAVIRFVNAIATALKDEFPNVKFETLAYQYTRNVCVTKPAENVIVRLCTIESCFTHPLSECDEKTFYPHDSVVSENSFVTDLRDWASISNTLYIWDYTTNFWLYTVNFSAFDTLRENVRFFAENNVKGVFEEGPGNSNSVGGEFDELRVYLFSKLLWDPYMTEEEYYGYMDDFLANIYGPGWTYIREYIDLKDAYNSNYHAGCMMRQSDVYEIYNIKQVTVREKTEIPEGVTLEMIDNYQTVDWSAYINYYFEIPEPELVTKGYELFGKAMEIAETDYQKTAIDKALIQVEILDSHYRYKAKGVYSTNLNLVIRSVLSSADISEEEYAEYQKTIPSYLRYFSGKYTDEYYNFNKTLADKMVGYGITSLNNEGNDFYPREANFGKSPREW